MENLLLWIIGIVAAISLVRLSFRGARSASPESIRRSGHETRGAN